MSECPRPVQTYPQRVPLKIIGQEGVLDPAAVAALIRERLGDPGEGDRGWQENRKGPYVSYTFWVVLPDEHAEEPLRRAIHALPGVLMQL